MYSLLINFAHLRFAIVNTDLALPHWKNHVLLTGSKTLIIILKVDIVLILVFRKRKHERSLGAGGQPGGLSLCDESAECVMMRMLARCPEQGSEYPDPATIKLCPQADDRQQPVHEPSPIVHQAEAEMLSTCYLIDVLSNTVTIAITNVESLWQPHRGQVKRRKLGRARWA